MSNLSYKSCPGVATETKHGNVLRLILTELTKSDRVKKIDLIQVGSFYGRLFLLIKEILENEYTKDKTGYEVTVQSHELIGYDGFEHVEKFRANHYESFSELFYTTGKDVVYSEKSEIVWFDLSNYGMSEEILLEYMNRLSKNGFLVIETPVFEDVVKTLTVLTNRYNLEKVDIPTKYTDITVFRIVKSVRSEKQPKKEVDTEIELQIIEQEEQL